MNFRALWKNVALREYNSSLFGIENHLIYGHRPSFCPFPKGRCSRTDSAKGALPHTHLSNHVGTGQNRHFGSFYIEQPS